MICRSWVENSKTNRRKSSQTKKRCTSKSLIAMLCRFNNMLTCYNVKKTLLLLDSDIKDIEKYKSQQYSYEQINYCILTSESVMKLQWNQPLKLSTQWNQNKIKIGEEWKEKKLAPLKRFLNSKVLSLSFLFPLCLFI